MCIETERLREREREMCVYVHIYVCTYRYIHGQRGFVETMQRARPRLRNVCATRGS